MIDPDQDTDPPAAASAAAATDDGDGDDDIIEKAASLYGDEDDGDDDDEEDTSDKTTTTGSKKDKDETDEETLKPAAKPSAAKTKAKTKAKAKSSLPAASKTKGVLATLLAEEEVEDSDSDSNSDDDDDDDDDDDESTVATAKAATAAATGTAKAASTEIMSKDDDPKRKTKKSKNTSTSGGTKKTSSSSVDTATNLNAQQSQEHLFERVRERERLNNNQQRVQQMEQQQRQQLLQQQLQQEQRRLMMMAGVPGAYYQNDQQQQQQQHIPYQQHGMVGGMHMMMNPHTGVMMMSPPPLQAGVGASMMPPVAPFGAIGGGAAGTMMPPPPLAGGGAATRHIVNRHQQHLQQQQGSLSSATMKRKAGMTSAEAASTIDLTSSPSKKKKKTNDDDESPSSGGLKTKSVLVDLEESSVFGGDGDDDDESSVASSVVVTATATTTATAAGGFATIAPRPPRQGGLFAFNRQQTMPVPPGYHPPNAFQPHQQQMQMGMQQMQYPPPVGGGVGNVGIFQQGIIGGAINSATGPVIMGRGISAAVKRKPPPSGGSKKQHKSDLQKGGKRGQYIKHMDPNYIKKRLHGIYKHACNEKNNYTPCIQQYCKKVYGESFEKHRRQMNKHFTQSGLLKLLEKRLHFNNKIVTVHIKTYVESWLTGELGRKRKKKEEAAAAAAKAKASSIDTTTTADDGTTYNLPRSVFDYARPQEEEIFEQQLTKKKKLKMQKNIVYEGRCKLTGKERVYFNHKDPRYIREHLYGIYKYGYRNNFTSNVAKYCEKAFKDEGPWEQNRYKYRTLSPHFTRSNLLLELKKETHYDSIVIQDSIDTYMNELIANKEVYIVRAAGEDDDDDDADIIVDDENKDLHTIELPLFYNEMTIEMEYVMKINDKTTRITQLNKLSDKYDTKNWLTKKLVLEVMNACRGTFSGTVAETTTAMETAVAMAAIAATGTATATATQQQEYTNTATATAAAGSSPSQQQQESATNAQQQPAEKHPPPPLPLPPPPQSDYELFSKAIATILPANRKFASLTQLHQFMKLFMSFWDVPRLVHGSGALSCHYRKRTLKRQMTPEAVERRRKSGLSKLDDYNCPFKLAYSKLRFAKNQNSRKWKPRIFHIAKVSNFNTCHNCKEFHDDKQNNYQNYDKSDVSAFADSVRSFKKPIVINIDNVSATITTTTTTPPITSWMYDKDAWINMTNHFFDQCCTIEEDEEFENDNNNSSAMVIRRTITIHQSRSTQERKKRSSAVHTNHNNPTNKGCNVSRTDIDAFVTNFDNLDVLVQFWSEFIKRNPNEAFRTNEWGGVFDILRTICDDNIMGRNKMKETKGLLTALGSVADPLGGSNIDAKNAASNFIRYLYTDDDDDSDDNNNNNNNKYNNNSNNNDHDNNHEYDDEDEDDY